MIQKFTIYCHTHINSGKKYVGQTEKTMTKRWLGHISDATCSKKSRCWYFARAIRKYGPDAFAHSVLEHVSTLEEANAAEVKWIAQLNTRKPHGYNLDAGGHVTPRHASTRKKLSANMRARNAATPPEKRRAIAMRASGARTASSFKVISQKAHARWALLTPAQKSEWSSKARAAREPGSYSEIGKARYAKIPIEQRRVMVHPMLKANPPEYISMCQRRRWAAKTSAERKAHMRRLSAAITPAARKRGEEIRRAIWAAKTPEQLQAHGQKVVTNTSPEARAIGIEKAKRSYTLEKHREAGLKGSTKISPETRVSRAKIGAAAFQAKLALMSEDDRRAWYHKRSEARRASMAQRKASSLRG